MRDQLERAGVRSGALVMVHSALQGIELVSDVDESRTSPLAVCMRVLGILKDLVGEHGTLAMPTHPKYNGDPGFMHDKSELLLTYDQVQTPSSVGLLTEIFRRQPQTLRSLHPLSSLAVRGPLAHDLLRHNLDAEWPLPHGTGSSYRRFCEIGGVVVAIGVPLIKCMTVIHVAEEVRDTEWPVADFFYKRRFVLRQELDERECMVRERRPEYVRSLGLNTLRRHLLREGIMHETLLGEVEVQWAMAADVFNFISHRAEGNTYPYFFPRLSRLF
ncbi:MAG: AAC(3) family N-acetyltransferase [Candidatus Krumholzibacteria bacterium]|nr:AAC(3) family N-acetyltransferase [Candidatus Krumholzibacteria bacterium]